MARRAMGFDISVIAHDPFADSAKAKKQGIEIVSLDEVLTNSDFISLHAPLTDDTFHVINSESITKMKPGVCIINTARGALIDSDALVEALTENRIAGVGLDVLEDESADGANKFLQFENAIITPHTSYYSESSLHRLKTEPAYEIARFLKGEPLRCPVNENHSGGSFA
jgi:D-3-phosphoglycerate dehydrogenase / 2-oxoglutarate reductase